MLVRGTGPGGEGESNGAGADGHKREPDTVTTSTGEVRVWSVRGVWSYVVAVERMIYSESSYAAS